MLFINPLELLKLENQSEINLITSDIIKKNKRKLFADIELSDNGAYYYKGYDITKSDCESVINELDNKEKKEFYHYLVNTNPLLNDYLTSGNESLFSAFTHENIYKLPEFIAFINPYFSERFDKTFLKAFKSNDEKFLTSILKAQILLNQGNINSAFKAVSNEINRNIDTIKIITEEIKNEKRKCDNESLEEIVKKVTDTFPLDIINLLPSYFQSQINKIGSTINQLDLAIDKQFGISIYSVQLMNHLIELNIDSVGKKTFQENYDITIRRFNDKIDQESNAPILKEWAFKLNKIRELTSDIEKNLRYTNKIVKEINSILNVDELNSLPNFGNEIKDQIAYAIRSLSISSWNKQNDIHVAVILINIALSINISNSAKEKFETDLKELENIKRKREEDGTPILSAPTLHTINGVGTMLYGKTSYFVVLGIPIIPISRYNCTPNGDGYTFYGKLKLHKWQLIWKWSVPVLFMIWVVIELMSSPDVKSYSNNSSSEYSPNSSSNYANTTPTDTKVVNEIEMTNGNISGCSDFKPKYDYSIDNELEISTISTDAALKIFDKKNDKCIRFVFIKSGTIYKVKNIPEGVYYLKIAYGNKWSVIEGDSNCKGRFYSNSSYKRDDDLYNFNKKKYSDGRISIPSYTLKLYTTFSRNKTDNSTGSISEDDFFSN